MNFLSHIKSRSAETLAEVLIALTVLAVGTSGSMLLVSMSTRATADMEARLTAYNLAREGVEAVRSIRDTNWLRFPGDREDCWDTYNLTNPNDCVLTGNTLGASGIVQTYTVEPDLISNNEFFKWIVTLNPVDTQLYEFTIGNVTLYTHDTNGTATAFSREIEIDRTAGLADEMIVNATVTWLGRNNTPQSVTFTDQLINY